MDVSVSVGLGVGVSASKRKRKRKRERKREREQSAGRLPRVNTTPAPPNRVPSRPNEEIRQSEQVGWRIGASRSYPRRERRNPCC